MSDHLELLDVAAAAKKANVTERTISQWIADGLLTTIQDGRRKLVRSDHLEQLMRDRYQSPRRQVPRHAKRRGRHA